MASFCRCSIVDPRTTAFMMIKKTLFGVKIAATCQAIHEAKWISLRIFYNDHMKQQDCRLDAGLVLWGMVTISLAFEFQSFNLINSFIVQLMYCFHPPGRSAKSPSFCRFLVWWTPKVLLCIRTRSKSSRSWSKTTRSTVAFAWAVLVFLRLCVEA